MAMFVSDNVKMSCYTRQCSAIENNAKHSFMYIQLRVMPRLTSRELQRGQRSERFYDYPHACAWLQPWASQLVWVVRLHMPPG
jgi:hypothetical protein